MAKRGRKRSKSSIIRSKKTFRTKNNQARTVLIKPREAYTVSSIELAGSFSYAEAKKEYTRLRNIANKRLKRLADAGYEYTDIYRANSGKYPAARTFDNPRQLYQHLSALAWFISAKGSTVSGQKDTEAKIQATLTEHFGTPADMDLKKFGSFMEYMRAKYAGTQYDSERAAKVYRESLKKGITLQQLKRHQKVFYENSARLTQMKTRVKGADRDRTARDFVSALKKRGKKRGNE